MNNFEFNITDKFEEIEFNDEQKELLNKPSGLTQVLLLSNWYKQQHRLLDFCGTTNEEAIKKILVFYKHKTFLKNVGDHRFYEGFDKISGFRRSDGKSVIQLGS